MSRFYITTPIYYVNAEPHLGHAYTTMVADAAARTRRLLGDEVFFLTGTDEHGQKIERAARKNGVDTRTFVDRNAESFRSLFRTLEISNDDFIRTTDPRHFRAAQAIWRRVRDAGDLYKSTYEGWYCTVDEVFVPDTQLVDGRCPDCGSIVERLSEESYFFRLSRYQDRLLKHYRDHPAFVTPENRRNEMLSFLDQGLKDLSVSRTSFRWGIPVPDDPGHVMYVWFDALTNYLTAAGFGVDDPESRHRFARFWPADVHLVGKEIVRQHAIYWPAFLISAGLPLPGRVVSHGWWLMEGAKMSKSVGNVVRPDGYVERFGVDALRYFVMREMVLGQDASFTDDAFVTRYNADLANDLGNLVSRVVAMIHRYCGGTLPGQDAAAFWTADDVALREAAEAAISVVPREFVAFQFNVGLTALWGLVSQTNKYLVAREPWALAKDPSRRTELDTTLYRAADAIHVIASLLEPVMPATAERIIRILGSTHERSWQGLAVHTLPVGGSLGSGDPLFPRVEDTTIDRQTAAVSATAASGNPMSNTSPLPPDQPNPGAAPDTPAPAASTAEPRATAAAATVDTERISIDDFMRVDLRVARILTAERVPKSKKLVKLTIDVGSEQRTLVAGIAEAYEPDALVGRTIVVVANLKPATIMGIQSNGMVLAGSPDSGKPTLLGFEDPPPPGTRVR